MELIVTSVLLGMGLAMDAFSVSLANGLNEPDMKPGRTVSIAGIFGAFQGLMPLIGWVCVRLLLEHFQFFQPFIPWIALALLGWIGANMIIDSRSAAAQDACPVGLGGLLLQGLATSIDALSVGFTIAHYDLPQALLSVALIGTVTFGICLAGLIAGKKAGTRLAGKAGILGGTILIAIGLEIFITGVI